MLHNINQISQESITKIVYKRREIPPVTLDVFTASFIHYLIKSVNNNIVVHLEIDTNKRFVPNPYNLAKTDYMVVISPTKTRLNKERRVLQHFSITVWSGAQQRLTNAVDMLTTILNLHAKKVKTNYQDVNDVIKRNNLHYVNITGYLTTFIFDSGKLD